MNVPKVPSGVEEIKATFGDITNYIRQDGMLMASWQVDQLDVINLPFSIPLSWNPDIKVTKMTCHKSMVDVFSEAFNGIVKNNLTSFVTSFGGCFNYRAQRGSHIISTHAWGIAIDLNPVENAQGTNGSINLDLVKVFTDLCFEWGGNFQGNRKDPMHLQYATNY